MRNSKPTLMTIEYLNAEQIKCCAIEWNLFYSVKKRGDRFHPYCIYSNEIRLPLIICKILYIYT